MRVVVIEKICAAIKENTSSKLLTPDERYLLSSTVDKILEVATRQSIDVESNMQEAIKWIIEKGIIR